MLYSNKNGNMMGYEVIIDYKKLRELREEIITNCSMIEYCQAVFSDMFPQLSNSNIIIKNINRGNLHHKQENMGWPDTYYYNYTYDKYYIPSIIKIIDDVLEGKEEKIDNLFSEDGLLYAIEKHSDITPIRKVEELLELYIKTNNKNNLLEAQKLLRTFEHIEIERPKKNISEYYSRLQECFDFQEMIIYDSDSINKLQSLFGNEWEIKISEILNQRNCMNSSIKSPYVKEMLPT